MTAAKKSSATATPAPRPVVEKVAKPVGRKKPTVKAAPAKGAGRKRVCVVNNCGSSDDVKLFTVAGKDRRNFCGTHRKELERVQSHDA
jgi:hypothetical protein